MAIGRRWRAGVWAACVVLPSVAWAADAKPGTGGDVTFAGRGYAATVDRHGCLPTLSVGGEPMVNHTADVARGFYLFQDGRLDLDHVERAGATVSADSDRAAVTYAFGDDGVTITVRNKTDRPISLYGVLDADVRAGADDHGHHAATPTTADWHTATFFRDRAAVTIAGLDRVWGPWSNDGLQVCEAAVPANGARTVVVTAAAVTPDNAKWLAALAAANWTPGRPVAEGPLVVLSPLDYAVAQRRTAAAGVVRVAGHVAADRHASGVEVRLSGSDMAGVTLPDQWQLAPVEPLTGNFNGELPTPACGWYHLDVRTVGGTATTAAAVDHVGVGEVFVAAGQSNSTNFGQERTKPTSGLVSSFGGTFWRLADDPQPGPHDRSTGGSPWPAFGDAMVARYHVPIGIATTGHGGTSVKQWTPGGELFTWTETRIQQLGPGGFRAVLWHQGESDWGMSADEYAERLTAVVQSGQRAAGWSFPWFVAQASYHSPTAPADPAIRAGQAKLWADGVALQGPDTDTLGRDYRDNNGVGIHFAPKGLAAHGKLWADRVSVYLDPALAGTR